MSITEQMSELRQLLSSELPMLPHERQLLQAELTRLQQIVPELAWRRWHQEPLPQRVLQQVVSCNEQGCWVAEGPAARLDGTSEEAPVGKGAPTVGKAAHMGGRKIVQQGLFAPIVKGAKRIMGQQELNKLRADVIAQHSKVISAFVDTNESPFGQLVLAKMFEAADKDGNGSLDRQEVKDALHALGFTFIADKQLDIIFRRADVDGNQVIDFQEFVVETPKTLRSSLIKLAKQNGHDLGFLA
eukprot:CAMPEP_0119333620 /NCGR_PEP_ID=MMETSP1333-20130426/85555_1 /TAXON_ID=418940 /ORGANISM="Scyphosphaera apsteinii, Strain RCC1455" /LENGTH=242 /DNA_ID=CAMNT_0007343737 /DNA_START=153 /DNA_END=881 /DNA_ORIENTATION=-